MNPQKKSLHLLYHFFHPDDVISARLFAEIAERASQDGWAVTAYPANRSCHSSSAKLPARESWEGGEIRRVWRPALKQSGGAGRLINTAFMLLGWSWAALTRPRSSNEVVIVGTDPVFGVLAAIPWRLFRRTKIIHWCHDVHPEASIADGQFRDSSLLVRLLKWFLRIAYHRCDTFVDLGSCMRRLLAEASELDLVEAPISNKLSESQRHSLTIAPWSLVEPETVATSNSEIKEGLFGPTDVGILYSGNLGRAHDHEAMLTFARRLRKEQLSTKICFAGRGVGLDALKEAIDAADTNITFAGFAPEGELELRLASCDIHMVSLKPSWTGTVVPSKFFGALAIGRPVLFVGSNQSAIAGWIQKYKVGWVLSEDNLNEIVEAIRGYQSDEAAKNAMNSHCHAIYQQHFSRGTQLARWSALLNEADD